MKKNSKVALLKMLCKKCPMLRDSVDVDYWKTLSHEEREWLAAALLRLYTGKGSRQDKRRNSFEYRACGVHLEALGEAI